ncbi:predicted protein [Lichtheimia corymbifera JMRC:FSU:9682]|uniref:Uncharacterized protein n=1 Tax=Lichtheimia corymbifera JMRC:FSU:9682 TaxID=1263082 RepID=A0A068RI09_9FUNG|nr:predicted protein [Lichtheimia corymbifera JMRC:FSU:9682]
MKTPTRFETHEDELLSFMQSCWQLAQLLNDTIDAIQHLEQSHKEKKRSLRYQCGEHGVQKLSLLVVPRIMKITEKVHTKFVSSDGPGSSPLGPPARPSFGSDDDESP